MRGTDSNDVALDGVFVPERRTFRIRVDHTPGRRYEGPSYRGAAMLLVAAYIPAVALGTARDVIPKPRTERALTRIPGQSVHGSAARDGSRRGCPTDV